MRITFAFLVSFAKERGYTVEKTRRSVEWWNNNNHSIVGVCNSVQQTYNEILQDSQTNE